MISIKSPGATTGASILSAFAASICCITPLITLIAGSSSIGANVGWLEPARPYFIGISIIVLSFAWYQKLKPVKATDINCNCDTKEKAAFLQSKTFLGIVTVFAIVMMTFPSYAKIFYPKAKIQEVSVVANDNKQQANFTLQGMTCEGCEAHVNSELSKVNGVIDFKTSYANQTTLVTFDKSKVDVKSIATAIDKTGYAVTSYEVLKEKIK